MKNETMCAFSDLNSILVRGHVSGLWNTPSNISDMASELCKKLPLFRESNIDPLVELFIKHLRTPDYNIISVGKQEEGRILQLDRVIELCRQEELSLDAAYKWTEPTIHNLVAVNIGSPYIADGDLFIPKKYVGHEDKLVSALHKAFDICVWGMQNPTADVKGIVKWLCSMYPVKDTFKLKYSDIQLFLSVCNDASLNPMSFAKACVYAPDVNALVGKHSVCAWWTDHQRDTVSLLAPISRSEDYSVAVIETSTFLDLAGKGFAGLEIRGDKLFVNGILL